MYIIVEKLQAVRCKRDFVACVWCRMHINGEIAFFSRQIVFLVMQMASRRPEKLTLCYIKRTRTLLVFDLIVSTVVQQDRILKWEYSYIQDTSLFADAT